MSKTFRKPVLPSTIRSASRCMRSMIDTNDEFVSAVTVNLVNPERQQAVHEAVLKR